mmetsp:Transcript_15350/g.25947  ORF Transcript_15350/g.25947 Transcript_15350/m.25947 type:complete len:95 (+) Transcript_15350:1169-1453(+)
MDQLSTTDIGRLHQSDKDVDYQRMDENYRRVLEKIKNSENESSQSPLDNLNINLQLGTKIEEVNEFIDDPLNLLARTLEGKLFSLKLKILLSYK